VSEAVPGRLKVLNETGQTQLDFIRTDLDVCFTFATVAETAYRIGNPENAKRPLAEAEKGYSTLLRFVAQMTGLAPQDQSDLESKLKRLRERLDELRRQT
jgi:hypothetical protein